ncbi:MAG: hypothetical protein HY579_08270 [Nitrospinae bacterium]|nr:hypothetical protein [Nitrospinota bacterium]
MQWIFTNFAAIVNSIGLLFDIAGAWLVAWEVVRQFKGEPYGVSVGVNLGDIVVGQKVNETKEYQTWGVSKYAKMKTGLLLLTFGFVLQLISNWI